MRTTSFSTVEEMSKDNREGLLILNCSEDKPSEWLDEFNKELHEQNILNKDNNFTEMYKLKTTGGRIDYLFMFPENELNVGKLAIWRLQRSDNSWLSDYIVNYKNHHIESKPKLSNYKQFELDMENAGLETYRYKGRFYYEGPAVNVSDIQDVLSETKVKCQWDNMGIDFVVYPKGDM